MPCPVCRFFDKTCHSSFVGWHACITWFNIVVIGLDFNFKSYTMYKFTVILVTLVTVIQIAFGQDKPYAMGNRAAVLSNLRQQLIASQLSGKSYIQFNVSSNRSYPVVINNRQSTGFGQEQLVGTIEQVPNSSFYLAIDSQSVHGYIILGKNKPSWQLGGFLRNSQGAD